MKDPATERLENQLSRISSQAFNQLGEINGLDIRVAKRIALVILEFSCLAQNHGSIVAGRRAFKQMPQQWVIENLPGLVEEVINLSDEYEYRRLLDVLHEAGSPLLQEYRELGLASANEELREAATEFL